MKRSRVVAPCKEGSLRLHRRRTGAIVDVHVPAMDGVDLARAVRVIDVAMPIMDDYPTTPIRIDSFVDTLSNVIPRKDVHLA